MPQKAVADSRIVASHHLEHAELLMLDNAVARIVDRYIECGALTVAQRDLLEDYRADVDTLMTNLAGPALDYSAQLADLMRTLLSAQGERRHAPRAGRPSAGAHRAA